MLAIIDTVTGTLVVVVFAESFEQASESFMNSKYANDDRYMLVENWQF
jgi:hypothetical protein